MATILLKLPSVCRRFGECRSKIYDDIAAGVVPPPVRYGARSFWPEHEIDEVLRARVAEKSVDELRALVSRLIANRTLKS